jgi:deoxyribodipyrimidine photo-lyase
MIIERLNELNTKEIKNGLVVYWMSRDQRLEDNWALLYAQNKAIEMKRPLVIIFFLTDEFLNAQLKHFDFMMTGLNKLNKESKKLNIKFIIINGEIKKIDDFLNKINCGLLVTDFNPLKISKNWKKEISKSFNIKFVEVDTHNIVPCIKISDKQEYSAYTLRRKIDKVLDFYLDNIPSIKKHPFSIEDESIEKYLKKTMVILENFNIIKYKNESGFDIAKIKLDDFINNKLNNYHNRNNPNEFAVSRLSAYLHFGQISSQRIALEIMKRGENNVGDFLEQLIVRKELSDNFCYYNENYDNFEGLDNWAKITLNEHRVDEREYIYSLDDFENYNTHDKLWNAAQEELVKSGYMHGYMRMYWAKKILEWTKSPEDAIKYGIFLNDKYQFDGRNPNGYVGVMWSIGGIHDRAWARKPVFGKIRYMSYSGCKRKFDINAYIDYVKNI